MTSLVFKELLVKGKQEKDAFVIEQKAIGVKAMVLVSDHPVFEVQSQVLKFVHQKVVIPKIKEMVKLANTDKISGFHLSAGAYSLEFLLSVFFTHLRFDASNLHFQLLDDLDLRFDAKRSLPLLSFENNFSKKCFKLENFDFNHLFQKVKPAFFVEIFMCLLHERKIVIVNNDIGMNAQIMQTLLTLQFPMCWPCSMLSYLSPQLVDYLDAPFPYIVGISKKLWSEIYSSRWETMDEDIVVFDIQSQAIMNKQPLPAKPQPYASFMIQKLEYDVNKMRDMQAAGTSQHEPAAQRALHSQSSKFTLRVKQIFLNFLLYLMNDFEDYYTKESKYNSKIREAAAGKSDGTPGKQATAHQVFDFSKFIRYENQKDFRERFVQS